MKFKKKKKTRKGWDGLGQHFNPKNGYSRKRRKKLRERRKWGWDNDDD